MSAITPQQSLHKAQTLLDMRQYVAAEAEARRALAVDVYAPGAHYLLALALVHQKRFQEALVEAEAAIHTTPDSFTGFYAVGLIKAYMNADADAEIALREALRLNPRDITTYSLLAKVLSNQKAYEESLMVITQALAIDPRHPSVILAFAETLTALKHYEQAAVITADLLQIDPQSARAHGLYAAILMLQGKYRGAANAFREALRLDPNADFEQEMLMMTMRARNPLYSVLLSLLINAAMNDAAWFKMLWLGWFILGVIVTGVAVLAGMIETTPAFFPAVIIGYLFAAICVYAASPLFDLTLMLDRFGRMILPRRRQRGALLVAIVLAFGGLIAVGSASAGAPLRSKGIIAAMQTAGLAIPLARLVSGRLTTKGRNQALIVIVSMAVLIVVGFAYTGFMDLSIYYNPGYLYYLIVLCGFATFGFIGLERRR